MVSETLIIKGHVISCTSKMVVTVANEVTVSIPMPAKVHKCLVIVKVVDIYPFVLCHSNQGCGYICLSQKYMSAK